MCASLCRIWSCCVRQWSPGRGHSGEEAVTELVEALQLCFSSPLAQQGSHCWAGHAKASRLDLNEDVVRHLGVPRERTCARAWQACIQSHGSGPAGGQGLEELLLAVLLQVLCELALEATHRAGPQAV